MRKVTQEVCSAFLAGRSLSTGNSHTNGKSRFLHGNEIAAVSPGGDLKICNGGWSSLTTKERLNGLPGVHVQQKAGVWYLNGREWNGAWVSVRSFTNPAPASNPL